MNFRPSNNGYLPLRDMFEMPGMMGQVGGAAGNVSVGRIRNAVDSGNPYEDLAAAAINSEYAKRAAAMTNEVNAFNAAMNAYATREGADMIADKMTPKQKPFNPLQAGIDIVKMAIPFIG